MNRLIEHLKFKIRWWRWFLGGPNVAKLVLSGVDKQSRRVIYERHNRAEPKPQID